MTCIESEIVFDDFHYVQIAIKPRWRGGGIGENGVTGKIGAHS